MEFPPQVGGVASYYFQVSSRLPAEKIVVLAPPHSEARQFDAKQRFKIVRHPLVAGTTSGLLGKPAATLRWLALRSIVDTIVVQHNIQQLLVGQILPIGTVGMLVSRSRHIPFTVFTHGMDILRADSRWRKRLLVKKILHAADSVIANSNFTAQHAIRLGADRQRVTVVYPCANIEPGDVPQAKKEEIITTHHLQNRPVLLSVGRLVGRKGQAMVLTALPRVLRAFPTLKYLIVGNGPNRSHLEQLINRLKLRDAATIVTNIDDQTLPAYYELCDIFVLPSRDLGRGDLEGFGIAYLEAAMFAKPSIAGKTGGAPEAVVNGRTGLLVNAERPEEIAQAILQLLRNPAYGQRLGMQGLERTIAEFDWHSQVAKIEQQLSHANH